MPVLLEKKIEFQKTIDHFKEELSQIRSGRAHPALLDRIMVEAYNRPTPLRGVASISVPDAKTLVIEPWDVNLVKEIEKAILATELGIRPTIQGKIIRLVMPMMTQERREQLLKIVKEKTEVARITLRGLRERIRAEILKMEKEKKISEDERFRRQDELEKLTKQFSGEIEQLAKEKEKDISQV